MLNRTNRTLSANLNRLNLGTRSFVLATGESNGKVTLRIRHAHGPAVRAEMAWSYDPSIRPSSRFAIPSIPGSFQVVPRPIEVTEVRPPVGYPDTFAALTDKAADAGCLSDTGRGQPAKPGRKPLQGKRSATWKASGGARLRAARDTAAARTAAAGG
jgi:hypothetical protein